MPIDDRTANRNYKLPNAGNFLADDVVRLRDALTAIDADVFARYTKTETDQKLADLINGAPGALDTLNELAAAMGNDPNFATTITNALAGKPGFADVWTRTQADARYVQGINQTENVFTGTGSQTTFALSQTPPSRESLLVTVDGVVQPVSEYSLSGSALILSEAPASGSKIRVLMLGVAGPVQSASTLNFAHAGAGTVTRTVESKLRDVLHVKDLGCACNGIADDGATLNAAIYARYGGLANSQSQEYVEIQASAGDVLKFATPVTVRQNRIRFIGNGAKIVCTGQYAFDFTQDGVGNINEDGAVIGWKITGATVAATRGRGCAFTRVENNWLTGNALGVDLQAVGAVVSNNYIRENTSTGILLQSAVVVGGTRAESQRCVVEHNRVYLNGGLGIYLKDGGGHYLGGNDVEVNTAVEVLIRSSFGNSIFGLYSEPASGIPIIQIDNASTDVPGRTSESNQIIGGTFGGGANFDINIAGGNGTVVSGVRFGTGNVNISAGVTNTVLLPCNGVTPTVTNNGSGTLDMTASGKIRMYASTANRILLDATDPVGGVVSGVDNLLHFAGVRGISTSQTKSRNLFGFVDISDTSTSAAVTFATAEVDQGYGAFFGVWHTVGTPASGSEAVYMTARATTGFTINLRAAPGAGTTVRVHWMIVR